MQTIKQPHNSITATSATDRMQQLLNMQRASFATAPSYSFGPNLLSQFHSNNRPTVTRQEMEDRLDTDTTFRWLHIPFVVAEIMWDRIGTLLDMAPMEKVDYRKECRAIRALRQEYDAHRQTLIKGVCRDAEKQHSEHLIDELDDALFQRIYKTLYREVCRWNVGLDKEALIYIAAAHEALLIYLAVCRYTNKFKEIMASHFGLKTRNVMPSCFNKIGAAIRAFGKAGRMLTIDNPVFKDCVNETVSTIFDIQLFNDEGVLKEKLDYSKYN